MINIIHRSGSMSGLEADAIEVAGKFGIKASRTVNYECDGEGTKLNCQVLSGTDTKMRGCASSAAISEMLDEEDCIATNS